MRCCYFPTTLLFAVYAGSIAAATTNSHRVLRAATKRSDLLKRETKITQRFESEVVYIDESNSHGSTTFASSIRVSSRKPILTLEEIEHHLHAIECHDGEMALRFADAESARDARAACHGGHGGMGGLIITSHPGCNPDGERAVYMVDDVSFADEGTALRLAVTRALWQNAFDGIDVEFGHTRHDHVYRRHADSLRAREQQDGGVVPLDTPGNATGVRFDLASELLNTTFTADDFLSGLKGVVDLPLVAPPELPVEIGCRNCSTRGEIVITQGKIKIDNKQIDLVPDVFEGGDDGKEISSVVTGGYVHLAVTGVGARLEMFARPMSSGEWAIALPTLPVLGFVIPGVGQAGASFEPKIGVGFEVDREIAVGYGIDVGIPDDAGIKVELGDLKNTTLTGIKGATLDALPFTSDVTDADIALSLAFMPTIPIGFDFSDKLSALVTLSLDLPRLDARLTTNAADQCNLLNNTNKTRADEKPNRKDADLSKLVLVEANISVAVDVAADLTLPLLPPPFDSAGTTARIFSTNMPLMASCVTPAEGALKITKIASAATITADKAEAGPAGAACTKHAEDKPCTCATATTAVYAAPPTGEPSVTSIGHEGSPPKETAPPLEMTPYYPATPTAPTTPEPPLVSALPPSGNNSYGVDEQPPTSTLCSTTQTLRVTLSTPHAPSAPPVVIISKSADKPCNSTSLPPTITTATASSGSEDGYFHPTSTVDTAVTASTTLGSETQSETQSKTQSERKTDSEGKTATQTPSTLSTAIPPTTTTPPKLEESKGFMAPPGTAPPSAPASKTAPPEFTGAAVSRRCLDGGWSSVVWQVGVLGVSLGMGVGMLLV